MVRLRGLGRQAGLLSREGRRTADGGGGRRADSGAGLARRWQEGDNGWAQRETVVGGRGMGVSRARRRRREAWEGAGRARDETTA